MNLGDLVDEFVATRRPGWLVLDDEEVMAQAVDGTRYYLGWGTLGGARPALDDVDESTEVSASEWAIISPLFVLLVEKENSLRLEASRSGGLELYGRQSSEVEADIRIMKDETLPQRAFMGEPFEVS